MSEHGGPRADHDGLPARLSRACAVHRRRTVVIWIAAAAAIVVASGTVEGTGGDLSDDGHIAFADVQFSEAAFDVPTEDVDARQTSAARRRGDAVAPAPEEG